MEILEARTTADRARVADVARLAFGRTHVPPLVHAARRIGSALCSGASAWLGTVEGEPAVSLLRYDFTLRRGNERRRAFGLGGVATRPDFRKRGLATMLCREVARRHGGAGLLFSAIPPAFYERLGYVAVPAWEHQCGNAAALAGSGRQAALAPLDPRREVDRLAAAWEAAHEGHWHIERDATRWRLTLEIGPDDLWLSVDKGGYVRVTVEKESIDLVERCTPDPDGALRAVAALADGRRITTWLPPDPLLTAHFEDRGRATTRPMLLGVDAPETARFPSADYF